MTDEQARVKRGAAATASAAVGAAAALGAAPGITPPGEADPPFNQALKLHSRLGAPYIIYLHFNGCTISNTTWDRTIGRTISTSGYDIDGAPNSFNEEELRNIVAIWRAVSEDYAPFNVDVTTELPKVALVGGVGQRVCIGGEYNSTFPNEAGGAAKVGSFGDGRTGNGKPKTPSEVAPALVFSKSLRDDTKAIWEATSHEIGHTLGLLHDGMGNGEGRNAYYGGHYGWAPIMGLGYFFGTTQWSRGTYKNANNQQDDVDIITNKLGKIRDDAGGTIDDALDKTAEAMRWTHEGLIGFGGDVDMFKVEGKKGARLFLNLKLVNAYRSRDNASEQRSNLDAELSVLDSAGNLFQKFSNPDGLLAGVFSTKPLPQSGTYYVRIRGVGQGNLPAGKPPCPPGTGGVSCVGCPLGFWSAGGAREVAYPKCIACAANLTTAAVNSTAQDACIANHDPVGVDDDFNMKQNEPAPKFLEVLRKVEDPDEHDRRTLYVYNVTQPLDSAGQPGGKAEISPNKSGVYYTPRPGMTLGDYETFQFIAADQHADVVPGAGGKSELISVTVYTVKASTG